MSEVISEFWRSFLDHKSDLGRLESDDDPVYDTILASLQKIDPGLYFAFCTEPGANEFIVTAEGKEELFPLVEEIVREAPRVEDWQVFALKPKLGFPETTRCQDVEVAIEAVRVLPVSDPDEGLELRLYVPGLSEKNSDAIHSALLQALDSGLGERRFAERVKATAIFVVEEAPVEAFPLPELDQYFNARFDRE